MKKMLLIGVMVLSVYGSCLAAFAAQITATATEIGGGRWQYSYDITNTGTDAIEQLTIWFDYSGYSNFEITTANAGSWSQIILAADDFLKIGAGYDILNTVAPLLSGVTLVDFSVAFDYSGDAPAMSQNFEIINPDTQATEYSGQTIPEPATLVLLATAALVASRTKRRKVKVKRNFRQD